MNSKSARQDVGPYNRPDETKANDHAWTCSWKYAPTRGPINERHHVWAWLWRGECRISVFFVMTFNKQDTPFQKRYRDCRSSDKTSFFRTQRNANWGREIIAMFPIPGSCPYRLHASKFQPSTLYRWRHRNEHRIKSIWWLRVVDVPCHSMGREYALSHRFRISCSVCAVGVLGLKKN